MKFLKTLIAALLISLAGVPASAAPTVSGVSGTLTSGSTLTITGTGFGTKTVAAPLKFDKFEAGSLGATISNGWGLTTGGAEGLNPIYSNTRLRTNSTRSAQCRFNDINHCGDEGCASSSNFGIPAVASPGLPKIYIDAWLNYDIADPESRNVKLFRIHSGSFGQPNLYLNIYCLGDTDGARMGQDGGGQGVILPASPWRGSSFFADNWRHIQGWFEQSTNDLANGTAVLKIDNYTSVNRVGTLRTRAVGDTRFWNSVYFGNFVAAYGLGCDPARPDCCWEDSDGPTYTYWDDAYVDTTQAHVEIGNSSTYSTCTHTEIQPPTSWSDTSIQITANSGTFSVLSGAYLYVVDRYGVVNSTGFQLGGAVIIPDVAQSYFTPQSGDVLEPCTGTCKEGQLAVSAAVTCPNNDLLNNNARIKVLLKNSSGTPLANVPAADIYVLLNGGTVVQGFTGAGDDTLIANTVWSPLFHCPSLTHIYADAATNASGITYITWKGSTPGRPGIATRDPNRKWGRYAGDLPVFAAGVQLQGRITSSSANGTYTAHVKNVDALGGGLPVLNLGERVDIGDVNPLAQTFFTQDYIYYFDFDNNGFIGLNDYNLVRQHLSHRCNYPTPN